MSEKAVLPEEPDLSRRWTDAWLAMGASKAPDAVLTALLDAYSAPDRHYHDHNHLTDCLAHLDAARELAEHPAEVELALWFHDAVYDAHAADNEERSAAWALETIREVGTPSDAQERVRHLILATRHHAAPVTGDERLIVDIDLSILGAAESTFRAYEEAVRREYAWVPEPVFRTRRAEILAGFLRRDRIYRTEAFHGRYEAAARRNLAASIAALTSGAAVP